MTLTKLLAATCGILVLAGCGTSKSSTPAERTPPADGIAVSDTKPATEATRPANDDVLKSPSFSDKADVVQAEPGSVATSAKQSIQATSGSTVPRATAPKRLTDQEVEALLESIENKRSAFEAALDTKLKNSTIKGERGEVKTNEFFDDLQDQVKRSRDRFSADYSASSEVLSLLQFATRLEAWASTQPTGFRGSREWSGLATDFRRLAAAYTRPCSDPAKRRLAHKPGGSTMPNSLPPLRMSKRTWMPFETPTTAPWRPIRTSHPRAVRVRFTMLML